MLYVVRLMRDDEKLKTERESEVRGAEERVRGEGTLSAAQVYLPYHAPLPPNPPTASGAKAVMMDPGMTRAQTMSRRKP